LDYRNLGTVLVRSMLLLFRLKRRIHPHKKLAAGRDGFRMCAPLAEAIRAWGKRFGFNPRRLL